MGRPSGVMVGSHDPGASGRHTQRYAGVPERMTFVLEVQVDRRVLPRGAGSAVLSQALHCPCPPLSSGWTVLCLVVAVSSNATMLKEDVPAGTSGVTRGVRLADGVAPFPGHLRDTPILLSWFLWP